MYELDEKQGDIFEQFEESLGQTTETVINQIVEFMKFQQRNAKRPKAVVGLSGGIDSSLTATLLVRALGKENVIGVKMPYEGVSSNESIKYANRLIEFLQLPKENVFEIPITVAVDATLSGLENVGFEKLDLSKLDLSKVGFEKLGLRHKMVAKAIAKYFSFAPLLPST